MLVMKPNASALALATLFAAAWVSPQRALPQATAPFQVVRSLGPQGPVEAANSPSVKAFDLSPAGQTLALLFQSFKPYQIPTSLRTVAVNSGQSLREVKLGSEDLYGDIPAYWPPQVLYTPDGRYLAVKALGRVTVMDAATLKTVRAIVAPEGTVPVSICGSSASDLIAVSFAKNWKRNVEYAPVPVRVEMVDAATGVVRSSWQADDVPQSLSPDGALAAVSDHAAAGASLPLAIVATNSGKTLAVLGTKYRFRKPRPGVNGVVVGQFLDNYRIVLGPDDGFDLSGHPSGRSLRIVDVRTGKILQEIKPHRFGPTGEIAVARGGAEIVTVSLYVPPSFYTHPHEVLPRDTVARLLIFAARGGRFRPAGSLVPRGGGASIAGEALPFQVSADGSAVAVGATVYERTSHQ